MVSMSSCGKVDCMDLRASKQVLESCIVAWLKKESDSPNPSSAAVSVADFETDCSNDDTSSGPDDGVSACSPYHGAAFAQPWRLSTPKIWDSNPSQLPCDVVDPLQMHALQTEPSTAKSMLQGGEHDCSHQPSPVSQTAPSLESERTAELRTVPVTFGVQLHRSESTTAAQWTVDAKKLRSTDRVVVSPPFVLPLGGQLLPFRMMLVPAVVCKRRGGHCFKRAQGRGSVQLKCEASDLPQDASTKIQYALRVGWGRLRGPNEHDFQQAMVCGLPRDQEDWNFAEAEDAASRTFTVHLEVLHISAQQPRAERGR